MTHSRTHRTTHIGPKKNIERRTPSHPEQSAHTMEHRRRGKGTERRNIQRNKWCLPAHLSVLHTRLFCRKSNPIHLGSWGGGGEVYRRPHRRRVSPCPLSNPLRWSSYGRLSGSTLTFIDATDPNLLLVNFFLTASRSPPCWFSTREICQVRRVSIPWEGRDGWMVEEPQKIAMFAAAI